MADYQEFRRKVQMRRRKKRLLAATAVAAAVLVVIGVVWIVKDSFKPPITESTAASGQAASSAASQPASAASSEAAPAGDASAFTLTANADANWNSSAYGVRVLNEGILGQDDGTTAMDFRLAAQPACGVADLSYFDNVTFVGDSITQGLQLYDEGLPNAHYCAYKGIGPNAIVNGATVKDVHGAVQVPMDALVASQPNEIYILLGTNVLVSAGSYDSFLAYYSQLVDMIQGALPGVPIYIQSITPVRPEVSRTKPGLENGRLRQINDEVAAMALTKGCHFIDLWEALADDEGNLNADYAQPDGIHLKPAGYQAWVSYLQAHTQYTPGVVYAAGTSYYIEN
ncbi:MAG: GDSL-type esterase/lipase family protein [Faecalibacterium sp.]|jgi:lysophospholipase L1-like esterase|nr:GDSL-type esterase/lipase family protein [Faecalibacterium sp.]